MSSSLQNAIAIIGMAGRFPKSRDLSEWWQNIRDGKELVTFFSEEELTFEGVDQERLQSPNYICAAAVIGVEECKEFDAAFFGFSPREAELMDPQHRLFLQCAWHALEHAGYVPAVFEGRIGVYAGQSISGYWLKNIVSNPALAENWEHASGGCVHDFLATRVAYKLNCRGPAITLQTACSTSLVAVHMACQSLLNGESDMALAGAACLNIPQHTGYQHVEGGILSPDGHCRVFDARAQGTVPGSGIAAVVLRRLSDAIEDRDNILAVIRGSAINNDGAMKVGFTAPGVDGQSEVISEAMAMSGVTPSSISYVEAHGTGTPLGDPAEVAALTRAFGSGRNGKPWCALGSVKSNMGHLDTVAGLAGLLKAAMQLQHGQIAPTLHCNTPNPAIDFPHTPFYINNRLREWSSNEGPRRAGVSSFGMGGTNAHVVMEEAPALSARKAVSSSEIVLVSGKTAAALERNSKEIAGFLSRTSTRLDDIAWTTQVGRAAFPFRRAVVCAEATEGARALEYLDPAAVFDGISSSSSPSIAFLFPGQGAQYVGMGNSLYRDEPSFRQEVDVCAELFQASPDGLDLRQFFCLREEHTVTEADIQRTDIAQPLLFTVEYAMARLLMSWGIRPQYMLGHSIGEYVAACLSGVMTLADAVRLVTARGRLLQKMPPGAMTALNVTPPEADRIGKGKLDIAAVNLPGTCVVSGPFAEIESVERYCRDHDLDYRRLHTSHAFHSRMMEPALAEFAEVLRSVELNAPQIPYFSNMTGSLINADEARRPAYWVSHLRSCVRFSAAVEELSRGETCMLVEAGPGQTLSSLARRHGVRHAVHTMGGARSRESEFGLLQRAVARLWVAGIDIDWRASHGNALLHRAALPLYSFERQSYWIEPQKGKSIAGDFLAEARKSDNVENWFYVPSWKRITPIRKEISGKPLSWLLIEEEAGTASEVSLFLRQHGHDATTISSGQPLERQSLDSKRVLYFTGNPGDKHFVRFSSVLKQFAKLTLSETVDVTAITANAYEVTGTERIFPDMATLQGACLVARQEHPNLRCRVLDLDLDSSCNRHAIAAEIVACVLHRPNEPLVALRGGYGWVRSFDRVPLSSSKTASSLLRDGGVYLITGGTGKIGFALAEYLIDQHNARVVLVSRNPNEVKAASLRQRETNVLTIAADVADPVQFRDAVEKTIQRFGTLNGIIHAAGILAPSNMLPISELNGHIIETQFRPKAAGAAALDFAVRDKLLDFCIVISSLSSVLGGISFGAYAAANAFLDSFVQLQNRTSSFPWIGVNFDSWDFHEDSTMAGIGSSLIRLAMSKEQGLDAFDRILASGRNGQLLVSTADLGTRLKQWTELQKEPQRARQETQASYTRPELQTRYQEPRNQVDRAVIKVWQRFLGIEKIGIRDDFFDLGGHSLMATKVFAQLREILRTNLSLREFFEASTVADLSDRIVASEPSAGFTEKIAHVRMLVENMSEQDVVDALQEKA